MKVLFVINGLGTGGAERSLAEMLPGLVAAGISPVVVCLHRRREGVERAVIDLGIDVRFLAGSNLASRARELRGIIRNERPSIVHTTLFESTLTGRLAAAGTSAAVLTSLVNTTYDPVRLRDPNVRARSLRVIRVLDSFTARHLTTHFHAITRAVKEASVRDLGIPDRLVTVIERGRDPRRLGLPGRDRRRQARRALGLGDDDQVLLNVGRQEFQKGQRYLLEAVAPLLPTHDRLVVLIAGRAGSATAELEDLRDRLGLAARVRLLGHRDDVPELLAAADVFVFPSLYEGLGCSVIEAMALALPVVGSDIPALREVVEEGVNAVLVPPGSAHELSRAISVLLEDPARARAYGSNSRSIFEARFTLERSTSRLVELYCEIQADRRPGVGGRRSPGVKPRSRAMAWRESR